jgi:hypothetical protein
MTLTDAREIWSREQAGIAPVSVEGWAASLLREDLDTLARASLGGPLTRLLPYFDSYLLGHRERDHLVSTQHRPSIYRPQGWISPVVLVDGRAGAVWAHSRQADRLSVSVTALGPLPRHVAADIRAEARDLGRFLGAPDVDVQLG